MTKSARRLAMRRAHAFMIAGACFVAWASVFIYRSSSIGIDGKRYFCLFDDAMISMRYAWNLSHGFGLVWNPGEYVEGYTNPLMTLLMSLPTLLFNKVDAVLAIQILGIGFVLVNAFLVMSIAEHLASGQERYRLLFLVLAFVCALSYYPLAYWSLMGMETGLLAVLLSLSILSALRYARDHRPAQALLLSVSLGLAFLTRTDTVVLAVPIIAYAFFAERKSNRSAGSWYCFLAMGGIYALFVLGQELFRWSYYGELLPNTYILKVGGIPLTARIENGVNFVAPFLKEVSILLIIVGAGILFSFRREKMLLASVFVVLVCYQVWAGGEPWDYWRILSPGVPIMLMLATYEIFMAVQAVFDTEGSQRYFLRNPIFPRRHILGIFACLLMLGVLWSVNSRFLPEIAMLQKPYDADLNEWRINAALAVRQVTTSDATVGVFSAGTIPYYSGRPAIDYLGMSDRRIARLAPDLYQSGDKRKVVYLPGHNKYDLEYSIKELRPTYAEAFHWGKDNVVGWAKTEYVMVEYEGMPLYLLKGSGDVYWEDIKGPRRSVRAWRNWP
jgi:arabinofuranosyltransferase